MALASQAALLDELMGINRNSSSKKDPKWDDDSVCKYYLAGFCPHELFVNTKMSLGACPKLHDSNLLSKYKKSSSFMQVGYEKLLKNFLSGFIRDVQRKIEINKNRLENGLLSGTEIAIQKRITSKEVEINDTVEKIEKLGNEGRIEECQYLHTQLEEKQKELKYDKIELENHKRSTREKQEDVCNICGAYISRNDPRNSIENHVSGRIHCGYVRINEILEDLDKIINEDNVNLSNYRGETNERKRSHSSKHSKHHCDDKHNNRPRSRDRNRHRSREKRHKHHMKDDKHDRSCPRDYEGSAKVKGRRDSKSRQSPMKTRSKDVKKSKKSRNRSPSI